MILLRNVTFVPPSGDLIRVFSAEAAVLQLLPPPPVMNVLLADDVCLLIASVLKSYSSPLFSPHAKIVQGFHVCLSLSIKQRRDE